MSHTVVKEILDKAVSTQFAEERRLNDIALAMKEDLAEAIEALKPADAARLRRVVQIVLEQSPDQDSHVQAAYLGTVDPASYDEAYVEGLRARHGEENVHVKNYGDATVIEVEG